MLDCEKVKKIYNDVMKRIEDVHIACFGGMDKPLFLISEEYPGLWLEHTYDAVMLAKMDTKYLSIAENTVNLFIDNQSENGQLPFGIIDPNKRPEWALDSDMIGFSQIQECVSFFSLALMVYELNQNKDFLEKVYEAGKKWDKWLRTHRMTTQRGLIEMFYGFDTGHDNSGRLEGMACKGNYTANGERQNAGVLPPDDGITPILAVDMNCNFYGDEKALAKMARILGKDDETEKWEKSAAEIKKKLFEHCFDEEDGFFYDVDRNGNKRKYKSSTILHLFIEKVLDKEEDKELIERIYKEHIKNPEEFWTPYPFPSMAVNDPSVEGHANYNCWGYYVQATIVLRGTLWMDHYGWSEDFDHVCKQWITAWTEHYDEVKLGQEIDPLTGVPTACSEWFSSCMVDYIYIAKRLGLV